MSIEDKEEKGQKSSEIHYPPDFIHTMAGDETISRNHRLENDVLER